jgi:hypothetical protein
MEFVRKGLEASVAQESQNTNPIGERRAESIVEPRAEKAKSTDESQDGKQCLKSINIIMVLGSVVGH